MCPIVSDKTLAKLVLPIASSLILAILMGSNIHIGACRGDNGIMEKKVLGFPKLEDTNTGESHGQENGQ